MKKAVVLGEERRDAIADAAIHLVANRGLRGLTHRAVDAEVGLPPGSTSYYLRTRQALLAACLDRLLALDETATPVTPSDGLWPRIEQADPGKEPRQQVRDRRRRRQRHREPGIGRGQPPHHLGEDRP